MIDYFFNKKEANCFHNLPLEIGRHRYLRQSISCAFINFIPFRTWQIYFKCSALERIRSGFILPMIGCIFAGCRKIQKDNRFKGNLMLLCKLFKCLCQFYIFRMIHKQSLCQINLEWRPWLDSNILQSAIIKTPPSRLMAKRIVHISIQTLINHRRMSWAKLQLIDNQWLLDALLQKVRFGKDFDC